MESLKIINDNCKVRRKEVLKLTAEFNKSSRGSVPGKSSYTRIKCRFLKIIHCPNNCVTSEKLLYQHKLTERDGDK